MSGKSRHSFQRNTRRRKHPAARRFRSLKVEALEARSLLAVLHETFDGVVAPALPAGWSSQSSSGSQAWVTSTTSPVSAPNTAFIPNSSSTSDTQLLSPTFDYTAANNQVTFRNFYNTESGFDYATLDISINNGAFQDILTAGGSFVSGGYNDPSGWNGNSGGYILTAVNLPASGIGQAVRLRWQLTTDGSVAIEGWRIDDVDQPTPSTVDQNFDGVTPPALPAGWSSQSSSGSQAWVTSSGFPFSAPNSAYIPNASTTSDTQLLSPTFTYTAANNQVTFRNYYNTESGFDFGTLDISLNGGAFQDILTAGGSFVSGGYNDQRGWNGFSGNYILTAVNLPASGAGQTARLRWQLTTDSVVGAEGWKIDDVDLPGGSVASGQLVGIDFGPPGDLSPLNWNQATSNGAANFSLLNLKDETGAATSFDLAVAYAGGNGNGTFSSTPNATQIPTHTNSLANIGGVLADETTLTFTFSDLVAGRNYEIYVFGGAHELLPSNSQSVTITGAGTPLSFTQSSSGQQFVNSQLGTTANLSTFAVTATAPANGQITITVQETTANDFAVIPALAIRELAAVPPPTSSELVGIDFGPPGDVSPVNWNQSSGGGGANFTLLNLINETGAATTIDLAVAYTGFGGTFPNNPNPSGIPTHTNSLANIGGVLVANTALTFTFSDLVAGRNYEIYVFGGDPQTPPFSQGVTISGAGTPISFTQAWNGQQFVNSQIGTTANLSTFAVTATASVSGQITIAVQETTVDDFAVIPALAIRELAVPPPTSGQLVGLDFGPPGDVSPVNWSKSSGGGGANFTLQNLIDETGAATSFDLAVAYGDGFGPGTFSSSPNPAEIPTHTNSLANIGGVLIDESSLTFTFSDLIAERDYEIYVFGGAAGVGFSGQTVTITGSAPLASFQQASTNQLYVNGQAGTTANLATFVRTVPASASGQISIAVQAPFFGGNVLVPAIAIRQLSTSSQLFDFGDAPTAAQSGIAASYPTTLASNGARHTATGPRLGLTRDVEADGQPTASGQEQWLSPPSAGDITDEDGVIFLWSPVSATSATTGGVVVNLQNATTARLDAWIDFNRDGDWSDAGEQVFVNLPISAGDNTMSFTVPANAATGTTFARFRVSTAGNLAPAGLASDGEVEDYPVKIIPSGSLDLGFDTDGLAVARSHSGGALAIQSDGRIVVAGERTEAGTTLFAVVRYNSDSTLDTSFDGDGTALTSFGASFQSASSVAIQPDGKIVVVGGATIGAGSVFAIARYNSDGSLDTSFDGDGKQTVSFGSPSSAGASDVAIDQNGRIVVAGSSNNGSISDFAVARLNPNGSLDNSFDGDGKVTISIGAGNDSGYAVAIQADGRIVVVGDTSDGTFDVFGIVNTDFGIVLLNEDGSLDSSFDSDGKLITTFGSSVDNARDVTVDSNGKIVVVGATLTSGFNFAIARLNNNGSLDTSFDGDGKTTTDFNGELDFAYSVAIQANGKLVVAGYAGASGFPSVSDTAVVRYNPNGSLDTTFDGDGKLTTDVAMFGNEVGVDLAIQANGKIVVLGGGVASNRESIVFLARYAGDPVSLPSVTLSLMGSPLAEAGGTALVTATLSAVSGSPVTVDLGFSGSGTNVSDYTRSATSITIPAGSTSGSITLTAVQDALFEGPETVIVDITTVTNGTESGTQQVTATITDDDAPPTASFSSASQNVGENVVSATVTAVLNVPSGQTVNIPLSFSGSATQGSDYTSASTIVIPAGNTTGSVTVAVVNDTTVEPSETVILTMGSGSTFTSGATATHTLNITDNDTATVSVGGAVNGAEGGGNISFTVTQSALASTNTVVTYSLGGTATAADYTDSSAGSVTIPAGSTTATISLAVADDLRAEGPESVIVNLTGASGSSTTVGSPASSTASIADNDTVTFTFSGSTTVTEGGSFSTVPLIINVNANGGTNNGVRDVNVTISISSSPDLNPGGAAFLAGGGGLSTVNFQFTAFDDAFVEGQEVKAVSITSVTSNASVTGAGTATVTIVDDDTATVNLSGTTNATEAGATGTLPVTLNLSSNDGTPSLAAPVTGITLAANVDVTSSTTSFAAGSANGSTSNLTITALSDGLNEGPETLTVSLAPATNATVTGTGTVNITDVVPTPTGITVSGPSGGVLVVTGTGSNDTIFVDQVGSNVRVFDNGTQVGSFTGVTFIVINSGNGNDTITVDASTNPVSAGIGTQLTGDAGDDTINGGNGPDTINGKEGIDVLNGNAGNDTLIGWNFDSGNSGRDSMRGGAGIDVIQADFLDIDTAPGTPTVLGGDGPNNASAAFISGDELKLDSPGFVVTQNLNLVNDMTAGLAAGIGGFEIIKSGSGNDTLTVINATANDGVLLIGGGGNDRLIGGLGQDQLQGDAGNDTLIGRENADVLIGGSGDDTLDYSASPVGTVVPGFTAGFGNFPVTGVVVDLRATGPGIVGSQGGHAQGDTYRLDDVENVIGTPGNDYIIGNNLNNALLDGGDGNDSIIGRGGNDNLIGGSGNDQLIGSEGSIATAGDTDTFDGGSGDDQIFADLADLIVGSGVGGVATPRILGGAGGTDILDFEFSSGITLFTNDFGGSAVTGGFEQVLGSAGNDRIETAGTAPNLYYLGRGGNDILRGGGGNDTLDGEDGIDTLRGGAGGDTFIRGEMIEDFNVAEGDQSFP